MVRDLDVIIDEGPRNIGFAGNRGAVHQRAGLNQCASD